MTFLGPLRLFFRFGFGLHSCIILLLYSINTFAFVLFPYFFPLASPLSAIDDDE